LKKLMATYATGAGQTLDAKDLHKLIDAVKEHRFHSCVGREGLLQGSSIGFLQPSQTPIRYAEEAVLAVVSAAKPSRGKAVPQRHYVFDKDMHFEGAIDGMFASLDVCGRVRDPAQGGHMHIAGVVWDPVGRWDSNVGRRDAVIDTAIR
jgi:hypothetical protein